jgi:pimeloyl-ACP methyl ester carboxylesterase
VRQTIVGVLVLVALGLVGAGYWLWTPDRPRAELEAKYLAKPADLRAVDSISLHYRDSGPRDRPAVILLHGFGSSLHTWEPWAKALEPDYRVIRFDIPGFGLTGPDPAGDYSTLRAVRLVLALMDDLKLPRATVIGHSMGGKIAWNFAVRYPERLEKLVLISPDGFAAPGSSYGNRPDVSPALRLMRYALPKTLLRLNLEVAYSDVSRLTDQIVTRYQDLMLAPGQRAAMLSVLEQAILADPVPQLARITAPVLLLWGDKDRMIPVGHAQDYLKALPKARLVTLPDLGHVPHEEAPEITIQSLKTFLAE